MIRTIGAAFLACSLSLSAPALAADPEGEPGTLDPNDATPVASSGWVLVPSELTPPPRPRVLPALYVSFAALEVFDGYSTRTALSRGGKEANPLMRGAAAHPGIFWSVKAGAAVSCIYLSEWLWRRHRRLQAVAVMVVSNGIMAAVVTRNGSVLRGR
jgi:hypothetical protein